MQERVEISGNSRKSELVKLHYIIIIPMTIYEACLIAPRATLTLTHIPVMTLGLFDTFPVPPGQFAGHIGWFLGRFLE